MDPSTGSPEGRLAVNYPASSPWVTGVGGTNFLLNSSNQITDQVVWNDGARRAGRRGRWRLQQPVRQARLPGRRRLGQIPRGARTWRCSPTSRPGYAIYCTAPGAVGVRRCRLADRRRHERRDTAAGRAASRWSTSCCAPTSSSRSASRTRCSTSSAMRRPRPRRNPVFDEITQGSNDIGGTGGQIDFAPLGCCTAGPNAGYNEAAGWGSVNLANLATAGAGHPAEDRQHRDEPPGWPAPGAGQAHRRERSRAAASV